MGWAWANSGKHFMSRCLLVTKKTPLTLPAEELQTQTKNAPDRKSLFCQGRIKIFIDRVIRGATLVHGLSLFPGRALCRVPSYPRQLTYALTSWNTPWQLVQCSCPGLTTPSAVHLTTCFLPDSQQHGLSGKASSPLSPLQRFSVVLWYTTFFGPCQRGNVRFVILIPTRGIG